MNGVIERVKNNVLLKCSTLNEEIISKTLVEIIDKSVYQFAEALISLTEGVNLGITEELLREKTDAFLKIAIIKKIKRKLFIDSLALQITNDSFTEKYVNDEVTIEKLNKTYLKELKENKSSNQLNMTEDLNLTAIFQDLRLYIDKEIISALKENTFLTKAVNDLVDKTKEGLEKNLEEMIDIADKKYLDILTNELLVEVKKQSDEIKEEKEGEFDMIPEVNDALINESVIKETNKFDKYDDMTLFNKVILSLNTKEETLLRSENKLNERKEKVEQRLSLTNKNIEANIERENKLSQRRLELNTKEVELNSKLSEAEVIFLNIKPLIKGLNKIKQSDVKGDGTNE